MSADTTCEAALRHIKVGRPVFPCDPRNKRPLTPNGFKDATLDPDRVRGWFENTRAMLGLPTGAVTGLVVVDLDGDAGFESWAELKQRHGKLLRTASTTTPRGGQHFWLKHPGIEVRCSASKLGVGIDIRGDGGYVIAPPSMTADGRRYEVDEDCAAAEMPPWLLRATIEPPEGVTRLRKPTNTWLTIVRDGVYGPDPVTGRPTEDRNDRLTRLAGHLMRHYVDAALVHQFMHLVNEYRCYPPLPRDEVDRLVDSVAATELRRRRARDAQYTPRRVRSVA